MRLSMSDIKLVNPEGIKTLEQYGAALLSSILSLRTLEQFHVVAFKIGILEEAETETATTVCWELRRLIALYKKLIELVIERAPLDEQAVIAELMSLIPIDKVKTKKPRKKNVL
jgi:hypothetical protein